MINKKKSFEMVGHVQCKPISIMAKRSSKILIYGNGRGYRRPKMGYFKIIKKDSTYSDVTKSIDFFYKYNVYNTKQNNLKGQTLYRSIYEITCP